MNPALVPVTIIGGYLGAGKTTLINALLASDHGGQRIAVLVNDFGAINIDEALIADHDGETIAMTNGCICCSIADSLGESLDQVLAIEPSVDQIVIEASGVADPAKVAAYGLGWPGCRLDAVVVLADAETIRDRSSDQFVGELVSRQLRGADLIIATKTDLVDPADHADLRAWLSDTSPVPVVFANHGHIDPSILFDQPPKSGDLATVSVENSPDFGGGWGFEATVLRVGLPVDRSVLEHSLETWPDSVVRIKGIILVRDDSEPESEGEITPCVVHRVGRRWSIEPLPAGQHGPNSAGTHHALGSLLLISRRLTVTLNT